MATREGGGEKTGRDREDGTGKRWRDERGRGREGNEGEEGGEINREGIDRVGNLAPRSFLKVGAYEQPNLFNSGVRENFNIINLIYRHRV